MTGTVPASPRVMLVHAVRESVAPVGEAFARSWPEARIHDLLDTSLSDDLAADGAILPRMVERFRAIGRYAAEAKSPAGATDAILFTCSAFGTAIDAVRADLSIPVLKPNEAAFDEALALGSRVALVVTFPPSLPALSEELRQAAAQRGSALDLKGIVVEGALAALKAGDPARHDALIAAAVAGLPEVDAIVLGQFSMARAAPEALRQASAPILTTPASAVSRLKELLSR